MDNTCSFGSSVRQKLIIFSATLATCFVLIVSVPLLLVFVVHYTIARLSASKLRPDLSIVNGTDAWFATEPIYSRPYTTVVWHLICEGSISVEELRKSFKERVLDYCDPEEGLLYRRLGYKWTTFIGFYFWEWDKNFNLNHHVRSYDYNDQNGMFLNSTGCTEEELNRLTGKLFTKPFKTDTSPWELLVIPNYKAIDDSSSEAQPKTVLCLRIHHSLADFFSLLGIICRLFDLPNSSLQPSRVQKPRWITWRELVSLFLFPYALARLIIEGSDERHALHPPTKELSEEGVIFTSGKIPWNHFRAIMTKYKVSSNAAVYAICAGAVLRLMKEAGLVVPKGSVATVVPYPKPNHPQGLSNHFCGTYFTFNPQAHSGSRLVQHIGGQIRRVSEGDRTADVISRFQSISSLFPAWFWHYLSRRSASSTFVFSNVMVPKDLLLERADGIRLIDGILSVGHDSATGICGVMLSMSGYLRIVLNVNKRIFRGAKIPTGFSKHVVDEIAELIEIDSEIIV